MVMKMKEKKVLVINDYCEKRIKPKLIRDMKTEAVLVFARTALERFFKKLEQENLEPTLSTKEDSDFVYGHLRSLLQDLQRYVVNVEYLIELIHNAKKYPNSVELRQIAKYEEPLINYYDAMAKRMEQLFPSKTTILPEFIVICVLCNWFLEEEQSTHIYPFVEEYNFLELIEKFELYGKKKQWDKDKLLSSMQDASLKVIVALKKTKYKFNTQRVSKSRKKRK